MNFEKFKIDEDIPEFNLIVIFKIFDRKKSKISNLSDFGISIFDPSLLEYLGDLVVKSCLGPISKGYLKTKFAKLWKTQDCATLKLNLWLVDNDNCFKIKFPNRAS